MAKEYDISRPSGVCAACGREMMPGEEFSATIRPAEQNDEQEVFTRRDFCPACWSAGAEARAADALGVWRSRVPQPREKKKLFVDNEVLVSFFQRLEGTDEPPRQQFRFVLALVLMRKKLLVYDRSDRGGDGHDVWTVHIKGQDGAWHVVDPKMDEDKIAEVSRQLGAILEGEL